MRDRTTTRTDRDTDGAADAPDSADESTRTLSDDEVFHVLYNRRRREIIAHLKAQDGESTVGDLAERIAADENDIPVRQLSSYERKRVYVGLYQNHLPILDDVGVVEYDKNRGTVRLREAVSQLEPYLDDGAATARYVEPAAAVGLAGLVLLGGLGVGALGALSAAAWALVGVLGVLGLAAADAYRRSRRHD